MFNSKFNFKFLLNLCKMLILIVIVIGKLETDDMKERISLVQEENTLLTKNYGELKAKFKELV